MEHLDLNEFVKDYNNAMKVEHLLIKYEIRTSKNIKGSADI